MHQHDARPAAAPHTKDAPQALQMLRNISSDTT